MSDISSSIAETNRQRLALGLAPLAVDASESRQSSQSAAASAQADAEERERVEAIRAELARRKEKRLVHAKVSGQSLGESLVSQTAGSAAAWIERSRKLGMTESTRAAAQVASVAAAAAASIRDDAYTSRDLAGAKVAHDVSEFSSGEQVVLTLKDSRILSGVADGLNEDEDELMNQDLADAERQKVINSRRKGMKAKAGRVRSDYDAYGDEEAELLAKYSDEREKSGLRLGASGSLTSADIDLQTNSVLYAQDEARKQMNQLVYSLDDSIGGEKERHFQSDFKEVKFKKKKKKADKQDVKNDINDVAVELGGVGASASDAAPAGFKKKSGGSRRTKAPSSMLDFLPEPSAEERALDLASRNGPSARATREAAEELAVKEAKDARYLRAIQAAEAQTHQRNALDAQQLAEQQAAAAAAPAGQLIPPPPKSAPPQSALARASVPPPPPPPRPAPAALPPPPGLFEEEEDDLLAASLARARRLAQQKAARTKEEEVATEDSAAADATKLATPHDSVRALADRVKQEEAEVRVKTEPGVEAASSTDAAAAPAPAAPRLPPGMRLKTPQNDGGIVFTATTEFVRGLQIGDDGDTPRVKKEGAVSVAPSAAAPSAASSGPTAMEVDGEEQKNGVIIEDGDVKSDDDEGGDQGASDDNNDDEDDDDDNAAAGETALTGVAAALRLFKSRGILKEGGNGRGPSADHYGAEKYDAFGHEQSMKEQFRFISHRFHGIEPGLKKQEKRLNRVQVEAQRLQALREQGGAVDKIAEKQRTAGSAHIVMDKKLGAEISITSGAAAAASGSGSAAAPAAAAGKKRKESGPFAQFGFGKGGFHKKRKAQEEDALRKAYQETVRSAREQGFSS